MEGSCEGNKLVVVQYVISGNFENLLCGEEKGVYQEPMLWFLSISWSYWLSEL